MRLRIDLETFGTRLMAVLALLTLVSLLVFGAMKSVAADLHLQNAIVEEGADPTSHWPLGQWLTARVAGDLTPGDVVAVEARAGEFDHRSDRLLEATAVLALVGMLVGLVTARPASAVTRGRETARIPLANTIS